jgi:hypothetical protein
VQILSSGQAVKLAHLMLENRAETAVVSAGDRAAITVTFLRDDDQYEIAEARIALGGTLDEFKRLERHVCEACGGEGECEYGTRFGDPAYTEVGPCESCLGSGVDRQAA